MSDEGGGGVLGNEGDGGGGGGLGFGAPTPAHQQLAAQPGQVRPLGGLEGETSKPPEGLPVLEGLREDLVVGLGEHEGEEGGEDGGRPEGAQQQRLVIRLVLHARRVSCNSERSGREEGRTMKREAKGLAMPPTRAQVEARPMAMERTTVGKISLVYR